MKNVNVDAYAYTVERVVYGENDFEYLAKFNQFEEVIGAGLTQDEAIKDAKENLLAYFEYCKKHAIAIPSPTSKKWVDEYSGKITVRMPKQLHRDIVEYAEKDGMSLNYVINDAIRTYLCEESVKTVTSKAVSEIFSTSYSCLAAINQYKPSTKNKWADGYNLSNGELLLN